MKFVLKLFLVAILVGPTAACGNEEEVELTAQTADDGRVRESLTIDLQNGGTPVEFMVELALTPQEQSQGLMHREAMGEREGMLFVFNGTALHNFWMKNTPLPLDIIFIRADQTIAHIAERTVPFSEALIPSKVPVRSVLELPGGSAERIGISIGDLVSHPLLNVE